MAKKKKEQDEIEKEFFDVLADVKTAKTVTLNKFWIKGLKDRKAEQNRAVKKVENQVSTANMGVISNVKLAKKNMGELEKVINDLSAYTKDVTEIVQKLNDFRAQYPMFKDYFTHTAEFNIEKGAIVLKEVKKKEAE